MAKRMMMSSDVEFSGSKGILCLNENNCELLKLFYLIALNGAHWA